MKTVLAPIDFSAVSDRVIEKAIRLARATNARLVLLHVGSTISIAGRNLALTTPGAELASAAEQDAAARLGQLQRSLRDEGVTAHVVHVTGEPSEGIAEQAERLSADYIVIGSHGHGALFNLLMGSTTTAVLKSAPCPVVIVPPCCTATIPTQRRAKTPTAAFSNA